MRQVAAAASRLGFKPYLLAAAPTAAIFFLIPFELYHNSREYWNFNYSVTLGFAAAGLLFYLLTASVIFIVGKFGARLARYVSFLLFAIGLYVLLADVFSPLQTNLLDGSPLVSAEPLINTLMEAVFFMAVVVLPLPVLGLRRAIDVAVLLSLALVIISVFYLGLVLSSSGQDRSAEVSSSAERTIKGNVYHIVLDEMQTDFALHAISEKRLENLFEGFTAYEDNRSNYIYTSASLPSYLTGTIYRGERDSFDEWKERFKNEGLFRDIREKGYVITMFSPRHHWSSGWVTQFITYDDVYERETGVKNAEYEEFVQIWFARVMPNFMTNNSLAAGKRLGKYVHDQVDDGFSPATIPVSIVDGIEPFSSVLVLEELIRTEPTRPPDGQYVYTHAILPHGPYVMSGDCDYDPNLRFSGTAGYYGQISCSLSLVGRFIEELKRLGRYESSTIIVHADTGHGHRGYVEDRGNGPLGSVDRAGTAEGDPFLSNSVTYDERKAIASNLNSIFLSNEFGWTEDQVLSRTLALLMIKPPGAKGPLMVSERPSQLIDLYPTMVELLALTPSSADLEGISLLGDRFTEKRPASFFIYPPSDYSANDIVEVVIIDPSARHNGDIEVAGYLDKYGTAVDIASGLSVDIGSMEDGRALFEGFSGREQGADVSFRWSTGTKSRLVLPGLILPQRSRLRLSFVIAPFVVNEGNQMTLQTALDEAVVFLDPGWNEYSVDMDFPAGEEVALDILLEESASPASLGMSDDPRDLGVRWDSLTIRYAP